MQSKIFHVAPFPNNVHVGKDSQYVHRIPALANERRQNSRRQNDIHINEKQCHGAQRTGRTNQNERENYPNRSLRWPRPIPYSTNSTTWAMATTKTIKESPTCTGASKQRIWFTINGTSCKMDARGMRISSKINMVESNKVRELCRVAYTNLTFNRQILPWHKQNSKRAYELNTKECPINQTSTIGVIH